MLLLNGCQTLAPTSEIHGLQNIKIIVNTPPLTKSTWSKSFMQAYPQSLIAASIYAGSVQPPGLKSPEIPDFGLIFAEKLKADLKSRKWWPPTEIVNLTNTDTENAISGNYISMNYETFTIAGSGHFVIVLNIKLLSSEDKVLWEKRTAYNGLYQAQGESIEKLLLKNPRGVSAEFSHAADTMVKSLLNDLPIN